MLHHIVNESKTTAFTSQRTVADAGEVGVAVETVALEHGYHTLVLHLTVFHDGFEDDSAVGIHILKTVPGDGFQELRYRKHGARVEPAADVIAADVIEERLCRYGKEDILQFFQVLHTGNLFQGVGVTEDEITETEVVRYDAAQVHVHLFRVLVDEGGTVLGGIERILRFGRLDDERHERILLADGGTELDAGKPILLTTFHTGKANVGNHT